MRVVATGDSLIMQRLCSEYNKQFIELQNIIQKADLRLTNLETNIIDGECYASSFSGGTWLKTTSDVLDSLLTYGFNYCGFANNHALDFSYQGMFCTLKALRGRNIACSGAGQSLQEASSPAIVDTQNGRAAIIAITSTINDAARAGDGLRGISARPGVNVLRNKLTYSLPKKQLEALKQIAQKTHINGRIDLNKRYGYALSREGEFNFGEVHFTEGEYGKTTKCNSVDLSRTLGTIESLKGKVDCIIIFLHSHDILKDKFHEPAQFIREFAHKCIDAGAHAIVGSGTHQLKPIEIYKGCPIMYSLGNFIYQGKSVKEQPTDFYEKYSASTELSTGEVLSIRSKGDTIGIHKDINNYMTVLPEMRFCKGKLTEFVLYPIELGFEKPEHLKGLPCIADSDYAQRIYSHLTEISKGYDIEFALEEQKIRVVL